MSDKTCQWAEDDPWVDSDLEPQAPREREVCTAVATHRGCQPFTGAVTCEKHKCRCARPIDAATLVITTPEEEIERVGPCEECGATVTVYNRFVGLLPDEHIGDRRASHTWLACDLHRAVATIARRAARWKALAKVLHADEIHYREVTRFGQKHRVAASRSASSVAELTNALENAIEGMEEMRGYVPFAEKWDHAGYVDRARAALRKWRP